MINNQLSIDNEDRENKRQQKKKTAVSSHRQLGYIEEEIMVKDEIRN